MSLCASVYMSFVVTCWERANLLALVCGVCCEFVTFPLVSWVRCGTWLYRFLTFAPLLTSTDFKNQLFQDFPSYMKISKEGNFTLHHYLNIFWKSFTPNTTYQVSGPQAFWFWRLGFLTIYYTYQCRRNHNWIAAQCLARAHDVATVRERTST